ncbi:MAG: DUF1801 domain-containing protein [Chloroflexia bacterium]
MPPPTSIDDYLAKVPEPAHSTLQKLRASILAAAPKGTIEAIAYGMPAFTLKKHIAGFAAFKDHCSYFPMSGGVIETLAPELSKYELSKGTVQFPLDKPLPAAIVKKLIQARLAEIEIKKK